MKVVDKIKNSIGIEYTVSRVDGSGNFWVKWNAASHETDPYTGNETFWETKMEKTINEQIVELLDKQTYAERIEFSENLLSLLDDNHGASYGSLTEFTVMDIAEVLSHV